MTMVCVLVTKRESTHELMVSRVLGRICPQGTSTFSIASFSDCKRLPEAAFPLTVEVWQSGSVDALEAESIEVIDC